MAKIEKIYAREVLDSRGNPTVEVEVSTDEHTTGRAIIPSGASTGDHEAHELRDNDPDRYRGKGVKDAVNNVNDILGPELIDLDVSDQQHIDKTMIEIDKTPNKSKLGANAILGISLACAHAAANTMKKPLFEHLNPKATLLPTPMMNIMNGGEHAKSGLDIQEFMIIPANTPTFKQALRTGVEIYHALHDVLDEKKLGTGVGDEGGFAPNLPNNEAAIKHILEAVGNTRYKIGTDVVLALDVAASEFLLPKDAPYNEKRYHIKVDGKPERLTANELVDYYDELVNKYPIVSIEDGLDQNDWEGWKYLYDKLGSKLQIVGDDIFVTNPKRLDRGITEKVANAILVKLNQIGTLTETIDVIRQAARAGFARVISHRSGETEDTTIADLAVAMETGQIKTGAPTRTDRTAKYNQLLRIEDMLGKNARYKGRQALVR